MLIEVQDLATIGQPGRMQSRPVSGRDNGPDKRQLASFYSIPPPRIEVRRNDAKLLVLPTAAPFWESLGLAPWKGTKDLVSACVFPSWNGMLGNAEAFMERMKHVYESYKLGNLELLGSGGSGSGEGALGLLPYATDTVSAAPNVVIPSPGSAMTECMHSLSKLLVQSAISNSNIVIFFAYSHKNAASIVEACTAFHHLMRIYQRSLAEYRAPPSNELVLQLVPLDMIGSPSALVFPSQAAYAKLCFEIYDRCLLFVGPVTAPAMVLEKPLPRIIDFKQTAQPIQSLMHENSCIHVAYAFSIDDRWVTAAWTDSRGDQQMTASYCVRRKNKTVSTPMAMIAKDMWEATYEMMTMWKVNWRVFITKCGPMNHPETETWVNIAQSETRVSVSLTLLTVDTSPSLQLLPPAGTLDPPTIQSFLNTPGATPQPAASPWDQAYDAAPEPDVDDILVDITDETWGAILSHRLTNSTSVYDLRPALASGYLIKRGGTRAEDPPVAMEVNAVHGDVHPRAYEQLLREVLGEFRALGSLARARGVVDGDADVRPWHVAAAEKGVRAVFLLL